MAIMSTKIGRFVLAVGALGSILAMGAPALAEGHGGGGHAGGGHAGSAAHGYTGGHGAVGHGYAGGAGHAGYGYGGHAGGYAGHAGYGYGGGHAGGYAGHAGGYYHGYSTGRYWGGGYWHGGFWPRAYYGLGFPWFLPILPLAYATYWYDGIPYYYANDAYYTWNQGYDGYTVTDPPPVSDSGAAAGPAQGEGQGYQDQGQGYQGQGQGYQDQGQAPMSAQGGPMPSQGGQVFMYPKSGQSEEQQSTDKRECQQWASSQADPSHVDDYRRAMMACIQGRGYSAQ
jgi:hypothetical protein